MLNMKKLLLLFLTAVFAVTAMAQTSIETALDLQEGANSHDYDGSPVYWKYTPPTGQGDRLLLISADGSTSITVTDVAGDGTQTTMIGAQMAYPQKAYIAYEGHTLYISAQVYNGTSVGFTASFDENAHIGGLSQDYPMTIVTDGSRMVMGDVYSSNSSYSYATYTADSDGVLVMSASGYVSYSVDGGASGSFQYTNGSYKASLTVKNGQTYNITLSGYGAFVLTAEMTHPTEGSFEMPFELVEGDNTVPAGFTDTSVPNPGYWYTYTNTKTGYGVISSDNTLDGGSIKVYSSTYDIIYGNVYAQVEDSYNLRFEMPSVGTTYYICITKVEPSAADETFTFTAENYQPGDQESNPIVIEQLPATGISTEAVGGTKYYAVNVPAGDHKLLNVEAQSEITNTATSVAVYVQGNSYNATSGNASVRAEVNGGESGQRYIIRWTSQEAQPITFSVSLDDIKKGDLISNPIEAVLGSNEIDADGTRYYTYTPSKSCKLVLTTPKIETTASFSVYSYGYYSPVTASNSGNVYSLSVTEGTKYYIQIDNAAAGDEFTLAEAEFEQGESRDNPVIVENGTFTFGAETYGDYWLQYTADRAGKLVIESDVPYNYTERMQYGKSTDSYLSDMVMSSYDGSTSTTVYGAEVNAAAGDVFLVNLKMKAPHEGCVITFTIRDFEAGEAASTAIELTEDVAVSVPSVSRTAPMWYKVSLPEASKVTITADNFVSGYWYQGLESTTGSGENMTFNSSRDEVTFVTTYIFTKDVAAAGDYYIMIDQCYGNTNMTLSVDTSSGIGSVDAGTAISLDGNTLNINVDNADVRVYTLSGAAVVSEKVSGNASFSLDKGIYIVKINNTVKKVIVR